MTIHVHIDRLVLNGLPVSHAHLGAVGAALEAELRRLLITEGVGPRLLTGGAHEHLRAENLRLGRVSSAAGLGTQIAGTVHRGMHR